jgi:hypothetical protein
MIANMYSNCQSGPGALGRQDQKKKKSYGKDGKRDGWSAHGIPTRKTGARALKGELS